MLDSRGKKDLDYHGDTESMEQPRDDFKKPFSCGNFLPSQIT